MAKAVDADLVSGVGDCPRQVRGGCNATRQIVDIMPPSFPADRLLVCDVYTPSGNWSSYPPHKHDVDRPPGEVKLEEVYYCRLRMQAYRAARTEPRRRRTVFSVSTIRGASRRTPSATAMSSSFVTVITPSSARMATTPII